MKTYIIVYDDYKYGLSVYKTEASCIAQVIKLFENSGYYETDIKSITVGN